MRVVAHCLFVLVCLTALPCAATAQDAPAGAGRASISGRVVAADTGTPLPAARVWLEMAGIAGSTTQTTVADGGGAFEFSSVGPGRWVVRASKAGYFARAGRMGIGAGPTVELREGQRFDGVTVTLRRGGVIAGRLVDRSGAPAPLVPVTVQRLQYGPDGTLGPGFTELQAVVQAIAIDKVVSFGGRSGLIDTTDDLGQFRLYGLEPGEYNIVANWPGGSAASVIVTGVTRNPIDWSALAGTETVPTYYPGTNDPDRAQTISLGPGEERAVQFTVIRARLAQISGIALMAGGQPAAGMRVSLRNTTAGSFSWPGTGTVSADGTFSISGVAPGHYWLDVAAVNRNPAAERGSTAVAVGDDDVAGVSVVTKPGVRASGTVVFESAFEQRGMFQLSAKAADRAADSLSGAIVSEPIGEDGQFELLGLRGQFLLEPVSQQWSITSLIVDGSEMVDELLDVAGLTAGSDIRVTVTDRQTVLSGAVKDDRAKPLPDHVVVLLRTDASGAPVKRVRTISTGADGTFRVRGLRAGEYVAGVVENLDPGHHFSPQFQERLRVLGTRFTLGEGEPVMLDLTPTRELQ
jgi:hypothetical protein